VRKVYLTVEEEAEKVVFKTLMQRDFDFEAWHLSLSMPLQKRSEVLDSTSEVPAYKLYLDKPGAAADKSFVLIRSTPMYSESEKPSGLLGYDEDGNPSPSPITKVRYTKNKLCSWGIMK